MLVALVDSSIKLQTSIGSYAAPFIQSCCFLQGRGMNEVLTELISCWLEINDGTFGPDNVKKRCSESIHRK